MPDVPLLDAAEQRILGSLLEKQVTVPASYPLSLNSLRTACNQSSSRDPVTDYDEQEVERVARGLKDRGLVRIVWSDTGRRTLKYHQTLAELLELAADEHALLAVLLLRGEQPAGALKTRTERLLRVHRPAAGRGGAGPDGRAAGAAGARAAPPGRAARQPLDPPAGDGSGGRRAGTGPGAGARRRRSATSGCGRRTPRSRARTPTTWPTSSTTCRSSPGCCAGSSSWPATIRWSRSAAARATSPTSSRRPAPGPPGWTSRPAMVEEARRRFPDGDYVVGDLRSLMRPAVDAGWGAVLAWYSLIHLAPSELARRLRGAHPAAAPRWLAGRRPACRRRHPRTRTAGSTSRST